MRNIALILAAGSSTRFGSDISKIYHQIPPHYISALRMSVEAFSSQSNISGVLIIINEKDIERYNKENLSDKVIGYALGGSTRKESVFIGLNAISQYSPENVLIHDAARPFVTKSTINDVLEALDTYDAVDVLIPVADSLKSIQGGIIQPVSRDNLYQTQTPQGFKFQEIYKLHLKDTRDYTDDISLFLEHNKRVGFVSGSAKNYKITFPGDLHK